MNRKHYIFFIVCLISIGVVVAYVFAFRGYVFLEPDDFLPSSSPDGRQVVFVCRRRQRSKEWRFDTPYDGPYSGLDGYQLLEICTSDLNGDNRQQLTDNLVLDACPTWSPDGTLIAFVSQPQSGEADIYTIQMDGSNLANLTQHPAAYRVPQWSPDGEYLAFTTHGSGNSDDLYIMRIEDRQVVHLAVAALWAEFDWAPDGKAIVFSGNGFPHNELYIAAIEDGTITQLTQSYTPTAYSEPVWSPDGRHIVYVADQGDGYQIYVTSIITHMEVQVSNGPELSYRVAWSPDGRFLSYIKGVTQWKDETLYLLEIETGSQLVSDIFDSPIDYQWTSDSQHLIVSRSDDWNADGYKESKLWLLEIETGIMEPISHQLPWRGKAERITFTRHYIDFSLP